MPLYEYRCADCGRKFAVLVGMTAESDAIVCSHCGASQADKLVSRPGKFRTEDARLDEVVDRMERVGDPSEVGSVREALRDVGKAFDDDLSDDLEAAYDDDLEA